jgi:hypothetical protein
MRSHSQAELKQRLYEYAKTDIKSNLPSVKMNNKSKPLRS